MKRLFALSLILCMAFLLISCGQPDITTTTTGTNTNSGTTPTTDVEQSIPYQSALVSGKFSKFDLQDTCTSGKGYIEFQGDSVQCTGTGVRVEGTKVTIFEAGCYTVCGQSNNGQIIVEINKLEKVHLVLQGITLRCEDSAPLWVKSADKVSVTLKEGTVNTFSDGTTFGTSVDAPNATIYAKDSLTFNGTGKLVVLANLHNGIDCSNDLKFISGTYEITAKNNALKGNDAVAILSAHMTISAGKDGIKSDTVGDPQKGVVYIAGGTFIITTMDDGIQAESALDLQGGHFTFYCAGKDINPKGQYHIGDGVTSN